MYSDLGEVVLKSGESVEAAVIQGPDAQWRDRIIELLRHKGGVWNWQNAELLTDEVGVEAHFYILHRAGQPFSHLMTTTLNGVGLFGHVWTNPAARGQGAASMLMDRQMRHFGEIGGRALFLGTGFDSPPFHIYRKRGFQSIADGSGTMRFATQPFDALEAGYFAFGETRIVPLDWPHWPASAALFTGDFSGQIRNVGLGLLGRTLPEGPLLPLLRAERTRRKNHEAPRAMVLQKTANGAVVGLATWHDDPLWSATRLVDLWCHPDFWPEALALLEQLSPLAEAADGTRLIAYADAACDAQCKVLCAGGFHIAATLPRWLATAHAPPCGTDVLMLQRS